ncbi:MAG: alpha-mannosidase [Phycisphaerae bacterium]|jgi:alpha-mannosidase
MDGRVINKKLSFLKSLSNLRSENIPRWEGRTARYLAAGQYEYEGPWKAIAMPYFCPIGKTLFLRGTVDVPKDMPVRDTYLHVGMANMEGLCSIDGRAHFGVDFQHRSAVVPRGGKLAVSFEFMSAPKSYHTPQGLTGQGVITDISLIQVDRALEATYYDIRLASETANSTTDEVRKKRLGQAVEEALLAIDLTLPRQKLLEEARHAREILRDRLAKIGFDPESGSLFMTAHSHIDTAWLWPLRETVRKCGRTFSTACRLMERFPKFYFSCSQPQLYKYTRQYHPELYKQIKKWVKAGRWETTGGMWVESDCNTTSGESLVRQILLGLRFFRNEFGTRPRSCWLPDVFGYPGSLPEILRGCGLDYFFTCKLHWQAQNPFPAHLFNWRGLDGTEVLAHIPKLRNYYNGMPFPEDMLLGWANYLQKAEYGEVLFPYGFGDGGGGVTEEMMEFINRYDHFPALPAVRVGPSDQYFDDLAAKDPTLPVWDGELYLETHRGTYTTHGHIKRANRKGELLLREAEIFGSLANLSSRKVALEPLDAAWENLLLLQFHDILPGSSIGMVYDEAAEDYARIEKNVQAVLEEGLSALACGAKSSRPNSVCVFNSLSWDRDDVVTATVPDPGKHVTVTAGDGSVLPAQVVSRKAGQATIVFQTTLPSVGCADFAIAPSRQAPAAGNMKVSARRIESRRYTVELNKTGGITRLYDKVNKREVVPVGAVANDLQLSQDGPEGEDAWNVHVTATKRRYAWENPATIEVVESGPVRAVVRVKRTYRDSVLEQDIVVYDDLPRIDFVTRVFWQQRNTLLKAAFPVEVRSTRATYEVQFGAIERPTHRNTSWDASKFEVCAQRWMDLSEGGYGVSLLNDCKYGHDALDNVMRITLLRGTIAPDPKADLGEHEFTYSLLPHEGDWRTGNTVQKAWELNVPPRAVAVRSASMCQPVSYLRLSGAPAIIETFKPADDGKGYILRVYEPNGGRGQVQVAWSLPFKKVVQCNLVEEGHEQLPAGSEGFAFDIKPYQIRTFRLLKS